MFYSQTFLARKGPLGTVWRAAHQLRVKKSQYASTDILATVDRIMFPEVPIALRMSAFLLLGIVRIYSKQVEILSEDCNAALACLRKAFASIELTLPENARQAPFQSITLPETFNLDALDLDDGIPIEGNEDNHLGRFEDITLGDQIPIGRDPYIAISFDEDIMVDSTIPDEVPDLGVRPMETDCQPPSPVCRNVAFEDSTPANANDVVDNNHTATQKLPEFQDSSPPDRSEFRHVTHSVDKSPRSVEFLRNPTTETSMGDLHLFSAPSNIMVEPLGPRDQSPSHKSMLSMIMEDNLAHSMPRKSLRLASASSREDSAGIGLSPHQSVLPSEVSPLELALRSTPPIQQRKQRPRKRKQFFDDSTVLTNKFMKKSLEDHSDLVRRRRNIPCSSLGQWKLANILRKEQVFNQPSTTGLCSDLRNMFDKDYIFAKHRLISSEEDSSCQMNLSPPQNESNMNSSVAQPFTSPPLASPHVTKGHSPGPASVSNPYHQQDVVDNNEDATLPETEHLQHVVDNNESVTLPDAIPSWPAPPASTSSRGFSSFDNRASSRPLDFEFEMATIPEEERQDLENSDLPNIPTLINTTEPEDLYFLEVDNSPAGSPATQRVDSLSARTRAVARYVKSLSPTKSMPEDTSQSLSLNKILQGKTRKLCARMFYETLVLKSFGLVEVHQDDPYGDISLQPTPKLSKAQI